MIPLMSLVVVTCIMHFKFTQHAREIFCSSGRVLEPVSNV